MMEFGKVGRDPAGSDRDDDASPLALAETLAARLCHDLSGLAGTLIGTLELAEEEGATDGVGGQEALSVSMDAARTLGGRLRLLRAAWGGPGTGRAADALAELLSHAAGFPRIRTDWSAAGPGRFDPPMARLLLNAAMVAMEGLPRAGIVRVAGVPGRPVRMTLEGNGARWPEEWAGAGLAGVPAPPDDSRQLQPALTLLFAQADRIGLHWEDGPGDRPPVLVIRP